MTSCTATPGAAPAADSLSILAYSFGSGESGVVGESGGNISVVGRDAAVVLKRGPVEEGDRGCLVSHAMHRGKCSSSTIEQVRGERDAIENGGGGCPNLQSSREEPDLARLR